MEIGEGMGDSIKESKSKSMGDSIKASKSIKESMYEDYSITEDDIDRLILEQKIESEEDYIKILKELINYKSFEDYVKGHEKEFDMVDISDDFKMIIIPGDIYPDINLDLLKKMGIIADHYGLLIYIGNLKNSSDDSKKSELKKMKRIDNEM